MSVDYEGIGKRIRALRIEKGWTQAVLAEKSGIEPSNMSHIERAATKLSLPTMENIASALEVTLNDLAYDSLEKSEQISIQMINNILSDCTAYELKSIVVIIKTTKSVLRNK